MHTHTAMNKMAYIVLAIGLAGGAASMIGRQGVAGNDILVSRQSTDMCAIAASFQTDTAHRNAARAAIGCAPESAKR